MGLLLPSNLKKAEKAYVCVNLSAVRVLRIALLGRVGRVAIGAGRVIRGVACSWLLRGGAAVAVLYRHPRLRWGGAGVGHNS